MKIDTIRALRGPNLWGRLTAIEATVSLGDDDLRVDANAGLGARLCARLPGLELSRAEAGAATLAHVLEKAMLLLQQHAGCRVAFSRTVATNEKGVYRVVVEYGEEDVGRLALELARELLDAAREDRPFDLDGAVARLRSLDEDVRLGPSTGSIVRAAQARGIPFRRLSDGSLVQLGWGSRARRILAAETDRTSAIAETIAQDKELTKKLLRAVGVPVPEGRPAASAEEAWEIACDLGLPVVVKPQYGNQGRGVAVNLTDREQVMTAWEAARKEGSYILVERFAPGCDHRLLVIGGRLVAAARREPPQVRGDGVSTIEQLVAQVNSDPRRSDGHATSLSRVRLDDIGLAVLAEQRYTPASVPPAGTVVLLRRNANLSTGGSAEDVTDRVHPEVAARAIDAARMIGLDIAGIDVVCRDVGVPLEEQGGVIVEINAAPGFRMHLEPSSGTPRRVGEAVVDSIFPPGENGRVPVVAVAGTNGKTTTVRLIAQLMKSAGKRVGMTCTDGVYLDDKRIDTGDCSGPKSARNVLLNPRVDAAVFETARGGILREGLGFDRCDVAVVTNIGAGDHLGLNGITTVDQLAAVKRVIVESVAATGSAVLNAADPLTAAMAPHCPSSVIYFARDARNPTLVDSRARGGRVVYTDNGAIVVATGAWETRLLDLASVPVTQGGRVGFQIENVLAAVGAAWASGISWDAIRNGLTSFVSDIRHAPARFNVLNHGGATIIVDYGHNTDALLALVDAIKAIPHQRRVVVFCSAGDRRDSDILRHAEILGDGFDQVILFEDQCNRGRKDGEIISLMRRGLANGGRVSEVLETRGEFRAIEAGLRQLRAGDLILLLVDQVDPSLAFIEQLISQRPGSAQGAQPAPTNGSNDSAPASSTQPRARRRLRALA